MVPGGRFREVYYWDSYFTMLGLAESGHWDKIEDMVTNFAAEIDAWGHIPNGNRTYYLSRSQPPFFPFMVELLATHEGDETLKNGCRRWRKSTSTGWMALRRLSPAAPVSAWCEWPTVPCSTATGTITTRRVRNLAGRRHNRQNNPNRPATEIYRDLRSAAASGWDFSSRWMDNPQQLGTIRTTSIVPVDLNSLMFHMEKPSPAPVKRQGIALNPRSMTH